MEEAFRREKVEADRLLREQKREYENKIDELKKVMESSMISSTVSTSGINNHQQQETPEEDSSQIEHSIHGLYTFSSEKRILIELLFRMFLVRTGVSISSMGLEKMAIPSSDISTRRFDHIDFI